MERNKLLRANYLDILFDGRNKKYGGYELRSKYEGRSKRATLVVLLSASIASAVPLISQALAGNAPAVKPAIVRIDPTILDIPKPEELLPAPEVAPPPVAATIANPELRIVDDPEADAPPPTIDKVQEAVIALNTSEGASGDAVSIIPGAPGGGALQVEMPKPEKEIVYTSVEIPPRFEGDLQAYLQSALRYPEAAREAGEEGRVGIQFVVNEDGSVSAAEITHHVSASLDAEALRVVRAMRGWKAGKQNGKAVKVYFTLPVTFALD